jgi:TfoX/Sxy family transcriptional regulator of competence genes
MTKSTKRRESPQAQNARGRKPQEKKGGAPSGSKRPAAALDGARREQSAEGRMPRKGGEVPSSPGQSAEGADPRLVRIAEEYRDDPRVTLGKLFASVGLRVDNKIFAMVSRGRLVVKLPKARVDELVAQGVAERFDPGHGRIMKEWAVFAGTKPSWERLAREAYRYVGGSAAE